MKKTSFQSSINFVVLLFALSFCFANPTFAQNETPEVKASPNHPEFKNQVIGSACKTGHSCKTWTFTSGRFNGVVFDVKNQLDDFYNFAWWDKCRYVVYKYSGMDGSYEKYQKVDDFTCNKNQKVALYASYFSNNTKFVILLHETNPSSVYNLIHYNASGYYLKTGSVYNPLPNPGNSRSDQWRFTTLSEQGKPCGGGSGG